MLELLTQSTYADQIGWMLIHSFWQFAFVAVLAGALQWTLHRCAAITRYHALLAAMCIMVALPVVTWYSMSSADASSSAKPLEESSRPQTAYSSQPHNEVEVTPQVAVSAQLSRGHMGTRPQEPQDVVPVPTGIDRPFSLMQRHVQSWLPEIVLIWFAGVLVASLRPLLSWYTVGRLRTVGVSPVGDAVQAALERTAARLGFVQAVELLQSTLVKTPVVLGYFRPVILLPLNVLTGLPDLQLELILAHELAHIQRHDYLINLLQTLVETIFFYHPGVWWLSRQIRNERELCCDDIAMGTVGSRADYGRALLAVEQLRVNSTPLSLGAHGGSLVNRIRRIAGCEPAPRITGGGSILCILLISLAAFVGVTWETPPATAESEQAAATTVADQAAKATDKVPADGAWQPGQTLDVQVIHAQTKEPLPGVKLEFQYHGPGIDFGNITTKKTDAEGRSQAKLPDLRPDGVRIYPSKAGFVPMRVYWGDDLPSPKLPKAVVIRMQPGTVWGGVVQNENGEPIEKVEVNVHYWEKRSEYNPHLRVNISGDIGSVTTDKDGRWRMDILPAQFSDDGPRLFLTHPDYVSDHLERGRIPKPVIERPSYETLRAQTAVMVMRKGGTIKGQVKDEADQPISGALIRNRELYEVDSDKTAATTAEDGRFQIDNVYFTQSSTNDLPPETRRAIQQHEVALVVQADGYTPELVHAAPDGSTSPLKITLKPGQAVEGRVTDESGVPLEGVDLSVSNWHGYRSRLSLSTKTDVDGKFRLTDAPSNGVLYTIHKKGYLAIEDFSMSPQPTKQSGDKGYQITLRPQVRIIGSILDAETNKPLAKCRLLRRGEKEIGLPGKTITDGRYEVVLNREQWLTQIRVEADGYKPAVSRHFKPYDPDQGLVTYDFRMTKAVPTKLLPVAGTVLGLDDRPLAGAEVFLAKQQFFVENGTVAPYSRKTSRSVKTDAQGQFEFLPEVEPYYLIVLHEQGHIVLDEKQFAKTPTVRIEPWLSVKQSFLLQRKQINYGGNAAKHASQTLTVRIADAEGNPVEGANVATSAEFHAGYNYVGDNEPAWDYSRNVISDQDGRARVADQNNIGCVVARHVERNLVAIQKISPEQLKSSETITITMQPQCKVFGKLTSKGLEARNKKIEWSNVIAHLENKSTRPMSCTPDRTGFHFYLPPGTYELMAYANDTQYTWKTIVVKPGQRELEIAPIDLPPSGLVLLEGKPAPELRDVVAWKNGGPVKLSDLKGKIVVLAFSGHWVADRPHEWMPNLFTICDKYGDKGLELVDIRLGGRGIDSQVKLEKRIAGVKSPFWDDRDHPISIALGLWKRPPFLWTEEEKKANAHLPCALLRDYGFGSPISLPKGVLIDRQGRIVSEFDLRSDSDNALLEKLLQEK